MSTGTWIGLIFMALVFGGIFVASVIYQTRQKSMPTLDLFTNGAADAMFKEFREETLRERLGGQTVAVVVRTRNNGSLIQFEREMQEAFRIRGAIIFNVSEPMARRIHEDRAGRVEPLGVDILFVAEVVVGAGGYMTEMGLYKEQRGNERKYCSCFAPRLHTIPEAVEFCMTTIMGVNKDHWQRIAAL